jgi:tRNA pseudouridine38-40 synthase
MPRYKLTIEYAGTRYSGWQVQKNARTVQGELQRAIREATGAREFDLQGSGRTDAGVHAIAQVAHLDLPASPGLPLETLRRRINDTLPADINVLAVASARHRFHARHDAVSRSYLYQVARRRTAFAKAFVWWVKEDLDVARMRAAAASLQGMHDFRSFSDSDPEESSTRVLLDRVEVHESGDLILVRVVGSHFIWKMVRRIVGVLVEIGRGGLDEDAVSEFLEESSPVPARLTAPASGLFLERVAYEGDAGETAVQPVTPLTPV